jgi:hypothetical protein
MNHLCEKLKTLKWSRSCPGRATERSRSLAAKISGGDKIHENPETSRFSGLAFIRRPQLKSKSGNVVIAAEAAVEYGFKDFNGKHLPVFENRRAHRARSSGNKAFCL